MVSGSESVIDTNPATPGDWYAHAPKVLIAQGVVAGDAALTALLRANGIADAELCTPHETRSDAVTQLHALMMRVPIENRVTVLSLVGPSTWKGHEIWDGLKLSGKAFLIALDGSPVADWAAWGHLNDLWGFAARRKAIAGFVDLSVTPDGDVPPARILADLRLNEASGAMVRLEDYFSTVGAWADLLGQCRSDLPVKPVRGRDDATVGDWRVAVNGNAVEQFVHSRDAPPAWKTMTNIGGRVAVMETHRAPSAEEVQTARFGEEIELLAKDSTCRIELQWLTDEATTDAAVVTGPARLLGYPPAKWDTLSAHIPDNLLLHKEWPPRGSDWLSAIKANNDIPPTNAVRWATMGWVPVDGSAVCSFISGRTVISPNDEDRSRTLVGVTNQVLPESSGFSLPPTEGTVMSPAWQDQVRSDLQALREAYIELAPWTDVNVAAVVLAAGMRPAVPVDCTTSIWLQGPSGSGKSWTASHMLSFHQAQSTWTEKHLPASPKDTATGSEQALAQTNIWVLDDLAPSPDRRANDLELAKVGDIVRSVYNKAAKRRSGVDLKARAVFVPHALLVVTSENEHTINSVRDRTIIVDLDLGSLRSDDAARRMTSFRDHNRAPGRLMGAAVQAFQYMAEQDGWTAMIEGLSGRDTTGTGPTKALRQDSVTAQYTQVAKRLISRVQSGGKADARHVEMAVDLMLGLAPIELLAEMVQDAEMTALFSLERPDSLPARVAAFAASSFRSQTESTPGTVVLAAIRDILAAGRAHIVNAHSNLPPLPITDLHGNHSLGWQADGQGALRPRGTAIGVLKKTRGGATDTIMLNATNAFDVAQRHHSKSLPPGTTASTAFGSVWGEGLIHPESVGKREEGRVDVRYRVGKETHQPRGVPIHIDTILGAPEADDHADEI